MYKVKLTQKARKELRNLSRAHQISIGQILDELKDDSHLGKPLTRELTRRFSYRIGVYRIIYKINDEDNIIYILTVGHRSKVYQ